MLKIAVVGATGAVGRRMLSELERFSQSFELIPLASPKSAGQKLRFRGKEVTIQSFSFDKVAGVPFVLMSAGGAFSKDHAAQIAEAGSIVIDNSSAWRMDPNVPLIVPEVNLDELKGFRKGIIANPNCSTIQMVVSLQPLKKAFGLKQVHVSTYQSVSGSGQKGIDELYRQLQNFNADLNTYVKNYAKPIATNLIPAIDVLIEGGHCKEEEKMVRETQKIMGLNALPVFATTVRVPTFSCHCESINVELEKSVSLADVKAVFSTAQGIELHEKDDYDAFPYPLTMSGERGVAVSRVRLPYGSKQSSWVQYWNVADNLNKGAATNAVQIMEYFLEKSEAL